VLPAYDVTTFLQLPGDLDGVLHFSSPAHCLRWPTQTLEVGRLYTQKLGLAKNKRARFLLALTSECTAASGSAPSRRKTGDTSLLWDRGT
jgi:hypothetical protein